VSATVGKLGGIRWKADMATSIGDDPLPSLDRSSTSPLYAQIRDALRRQIDSHILPPGAPLPTEDELQIRYGVSRSVVRQALGELAQLGLIHRQRGRGSVVAPLDQHRRRASQAGGLRQQVAEAGQQLRTEVISLDRDDPPAAAQQALGTPDTWRLERVRYVDDAAVIFMRTWLPRDLFPKIPAIVLNGDRPEWRVVARLDADDRRPTLRRSASPTSRARRRRSRNPTWRAPRRPTAPTRRRHYRCPRQRS
jgi:GntR family transcriptional regulator